MARSRWKLKYFSHSIWRKIFFLKFNNVFKKKKLIFDRSSVIPECFYSQIMRVHKGHIFKKLLIHMYNTGFKFGEFSYTRKPFHFPLKKSLKRKNIYFRR